jgi:hypothetical protein
VADPKIVDGNKAFAEGIAREVLRRVGISGATLSWRANKPTNYLLEIHLGDRLEHLTIPYDWIIVVDRRGAIETLLRGVIRDLFGKDTTD